MKITAVVEKIENGNAILKSNEFGIEVSIPADTIKGIYGKGEVITLTIDKNDDMEKT